MANTRFIKRLDIRAIEVHSYIHQEGFNQTIFDRR
jgi:hypothetical protein